MSEFADPTARPAGLAFIINFDGKCLTGSIAITSSKEIDRLAKVLLAQKAAFEAMETARIATPEEAEQAKAKSA